MMKLFYCFCDISKRNLFVPSSDVAAVVECVDKVPIIIIKGVLRMHARRSERCRRSVGEEEEEEEEKDR